ncbi:MAG: GIY-YIG nuclease family protein [Bacteroidetes bacterium]|jgi:putative endonuclease|nr:GIY-YIG nuclease family protein [Bacteroidota bacterium]
MYHVYVLLSLKSNIYYVGQTADLDERIIQHNFSATDSFTSKHRPWELKASIPVDNLSKAIRIEKYIKKQKRKSFIELIILKQKDDDFLKWLFLKSNIL